MTIRNAIWLGPPYHHRKNADDNDNTDNKVLNFWKIHKNQDKKSIDFKLVHHELGVTLFIFTQEEVSYNLFKTSRKARKFIKKIKLREINKNLEDK